MATAKRIRSFAVVAPRWPRVLILGSAPSIKSLERNQYYAHPRNAFWPIMIKLLAINPQANYRQRLNMLKRARLALWDIFQCCRRCGSADTAIERGSEEPNDIVGWLHSRGSVRFIWLNGGKADDGFRRHIAPRLRKTGLSLKIIALPSTSPANARMNFNEKRRRWRSAMRQSRAPLRT